MIAFKIILVFLGIIILGGGVIFTLDMMKKWKEYDIWHNILHVTTLIATFVIGVESIAYPFI